MKQLKYALYILVFWQISFFTSCGDTEHYDFPGDPYNRVYIASNVMSFQIEQSPTNTINNVDFKLTLKSTLKASSEIKATVEVDSSLVKEYNKKYGTEYGTMPNSAINIKNQTLTIPPHTGTTTDTLHVTLTDNKTILASLNNENGYLIPLRIVAAKGDNVQPSTNFNVAYLIVNVSEDNVNHDATKEDIKGTLITDQTGWTASTNAKVADFYHPLETLFDNDPSSYCYIYAEDQSASYNLDIDMGKEYTFDAFTLYYKGWQGDTGSLSSDMLVYLSTDGIKWKQSGKITATSQYCIFYSPMKARYIRLVKNKGEIIQAGVFNIYATNKQ